MSISVSKSSIFFRIHVLLSRGKEYMQVLYQGELYTWNEKKWLDKDGKAVSSSFGRELHNEYAHTVKLDYSLLQEHLQYIHHLVQWKQFETAIILYYKLLKSAKKDLLVKDMDMILSNMCITFSYMGYRKGAIDLYENYGRNRNLSYFHEKMRNRFSKEYEKLNDKFEREAKQTKLKLEDGRVRKHIMITAWAGYDYLENLGQFVMLMECSGTYRMLRVRDIKYCSSSSQVLLLAYAYAIALLKEPCMITLQANTPTGLTNIFDKQYPNKIMKQNVTNARKKVDVKNRILNGKHIILKEGNKATREGIEEIILHKKLKMSGDKDTFVAVYKAHMKEEIREAKRKETQEKS